MRALETLKKYFGYDSFRGGQDEIVSAILEGKDCLGIMPTGAGKSICFQLPAIISNGITLVVSPLISLMKDQVGSLIQSGVPAAYINSSLTPRQQSMAIYNAKQGKYKLIYVAPERLMTPDFMEFALSVNITMLTVDEAHCISQWGQDFRPSYLDIPVFVDSLKTRPIVSAFTATATKRVRDDILELLKLNDPLVLTTGFDRKNLYFQVDKPQNKMNALLEFLKKQEDKSGIVYCSTRKTTEEVSEAIRGFGYKAAPYHAGLSDEERHRSQDDFLYDRIKIMVATNAFGMGIDKSNVSFVVHYNMPKDIESYYQEAGRAGRDGSSAQCLLLYSPQDVRTNLWFIENSDDNELLDPEALEKIKARDKDRLKLMTFYATTNDCLRGNILRYFGENPQPYCGYCSNCNTNFESVDITRDAQMVLSCVSRMREHFGAKLVVDVLKGSKNQKIFELGFDKLSTYGISDKSAHNLHNIIEKLIREEYLIRSEGQYATLSLGKNAKKVLSGEVELEMKLAKEIKPSAKEKMDIPLTEDKIALLNKLKELRKKIASIQSVPAFVVFSDSSLIDMCQKLPVNSAEFLKISGVGEAKLQKYGDKFIAEINNFIN